MAETTERRIIGARVEVAADGTATITWGVPLGEDDDPSPLERVYRMCPDCWGTRHVGEHGAECGRCRAEGYLPMPANTASVAAEACEDLAAAIEGLRRPKPGAREAAADYRAAARALRGEG